MRSALIAAVVLVGLAALSRSHTIMDGVSPEGNADQITNLPGLASPPPFNQYAGYLTVDAVNQRNIFYWLVMSQTAPADAPVFLWSNGGPGCSGLIGFFTEHGPFAPNSDGATLTTNYDLSWNKVVNMLYIEAPAGVGFSYSNVQSDYNTGDSKTASDNYKAILAFLVKFPMFATTPFYISSESYGGHYMPTLAAAIVAGNGAGKNPAINFKGVLVGNPFTDPYENQIGAYGRWAGAGLISKPTADMITLHCFQNQDSQCAQWENQASNEVGNLDPYALDWPVCTSSGAQSRRLLEYIGKTVRMPGYPYDPCRESYMTTYLNVAAVQQAIHANTKLPYQWSECSNVLNYNQTDGNVPMEPIWMNLITNTTGLHLTVYSGDDDSVCGLLGTQHWMYGLNLPELASWTPWTDNNGQVGGYVVKWQGINLVTVHTAGHEVPTFEPERAFTLLTNYLAGVW